MPFKARIFFDLEDRNQIARRTVARAGHPMTPEGEVVMVRDTRGHIHLHRLVVTDPAIPPALGTRIGYDGPLAVTGRAGADGHQRPEQRLRGPPHLTGPAARPARRRLGALPRAGARALGTRIQSLDLHGLGRARRHLGERQPQRHLDVLPPAPVPLLPLAAAEKRVEAAEPAEVPHEDVERFREVHVVHLRATTPTSRGAANARLTIPVIGGALLGIPEHHVRLRDLLELLFRPLVAIVAVGMVLHRQLAIGALHVLRRRVHRDAQRLVEVAHARSSPIRRLVWLTSATTSVGRHARRSQHADHPGERPHLVARRHEREGRELGILMLAPDGDR